LYVPYKHSARVLLDQISCKKRRFHDEVLEDTLTKRVTGYGQILRMKLEHNVQKNILVKSDNGSPLQDYVDATGVIKNS
jgi:hypothetical protein